MLRLVFPRLRFEFRVPHQELARRAVSEAIRQPVNFQGFKRSRRKISRPIVLDGRRRRDAGNRDRVARLRRVVRRNRDARLRRLVRRFRSDRLRRLVRRFRSDRLRDRDARLRRVDFSLHLRERRYRASLRLILRLLRRQLQRGFNVAQRRFVIARFASRNRRFVKRFRFRGLHVRQRKIGKIAATIRRLRPRVPRPARMRARQLPRSRKRLQERNDAVPVFVADFAQTFREIISKQAVPQFFVFVTDPVVRATLHNDDARRRVQRAQAFRRAERLRSRAQIFAASVDQSPLEFRPARVQVFEQLRERNGRREIDDRPLVRDRVRRREGDVRREPVEAFRLQAVSGAHDEKGVVRAGGVDRAAQFSFDIPLRRRASCVFAPGSRRQDDDIFRREPQFDQAPADKFDVGVGEAQIGKLRVIVDADQDGSPNAGGRVVLRFAPF